MTAEKRRAGQQQQDRRGEAGRAAEDGRAGQQGRGKQWRQRQEKPPTAYFRAQNAAPEGVEDAPAQKGQVDRQFK